MENSFKKLFETILNTNIYYYEKIKIMDDYKLNDELFIILSNKNLYFINRDLEEIKFSFNYSQIIKFIVEKSNYFLTTLILEDTFYDENKIFYIITQSRDELIKNFKISFKTYYLIEKGKIISFPLFKGKYTKNKIKSLFIKNFKYPEMTLKEDTNFEYENIKGYKFIMPKKFRKRDYNNIYYYEKDDEFKFNNTKNNDYHSFINIEFNINIPLQTLNILNNKTSLEYYATELLNNVMKYYDHSFWIINNDSYNKRFNLSNDNSQWKGWKIEVYCENEDVCYLIFLRRKFKPPIFDNYDDLCIFYKGKKEHIEKENFLLIADSLNNSEGNYQVLKKMVELNSNNLLYNDDTYLFWKNNYNIEPQIKEIAIDLVEYILLKMTDGGIFKYLLEEFRKLYPERQVNVNNNFTSFIENLFSKNKLINEETISDNKKNIWLRKQLDYIIYFIDQAALPDKLHLDLIVELYNNMENSEQKKKIRPLFPFLLGLNRIDSSVLNFELNIYQTITNYMNSKDHKNWIYNETSMMNFIKNLLIQEEIFNDDSNLYLKFISRLLDIEETKTSIKLAILQSLFLTFSRLDRPDKIASDFYDILEQNKSLLLTIIQILSFEQNNDLITFGLISLLSIVKNKGKLSLFLVNEGNILIPLKRLFRHKHKSPNIFLYDIELIKNLCFSPENLESINYELSNDLINILFIFKNSNYDKSIINILQKLIECFILLRENRDFKNKIIEDENFSEIINLYKSNHDYILKERILQFVINLIIQDDSLKTKIENIIKIFLDDLIILFNNKKLKIIQRLLHIFLLLKNSQILMEEISKQPEIYNILGNLKYVEFENIPNIAFNLMNNIDQNNRS